jgi:hypothetical protein
LGDLGGKIKDYKHDKGWELEEELKGLQVLGVLGIIILQSL